MSRDPWTCHLCEGSNLVADEYGCDVDCPECVCLDCGDPACEGTCDLDLVEPAHPTCHRCGKLDCHESGHLFAGLIDPRACLRCLSVTCDARCLDRARNLAELEAEIESITCQPALVTVDLDTLEFPW